MSTAEWNVFTGADADERIREAMRRACVESVLRGFVKRYGWTPPQADRSDESTRRFTR
jgi:hypothetical protein